MFKEWNEYLVGRLAKREEIEEGLTKRPIFINSCNSLQFNIKLISEEPNDFPNNKIFTAYTSDLERCEYVDNIIKSDDERIEELEKYLEKNVLIFKPVQKGENFVVKDLKISVKSNGYTTRSTYKPIPVFSEKNIEGGYEVFIEAIRSKKYIGDIKGISKAIEDTPRILIWEDDSKPKVIGEFTSHINAFAGFKFEYENLKEIEFEECWYEDIISHPNLENIYFIENNIYSKIEKKILNVEKKIQKEKIEKLDIEENIFLKEFIDTTKEMGLMYTEEDLLNFHISMKSSNLTILSGMSGTGKTQIVRAYGRALGLDDTQLKIIPVRPSWADDSDLLGYVDSIHNTYRPSDSGLVNVLRDAQKNMEKIFIVCLDEMNLARVEHYFSQFLSVLEGDTVSKKLKLYNSDMEGKLYNSEQYKPEIIIGNNIMFVGTVNLDETTYHFSDKVLDRANVISLNTVDFKSLIEVKIEKKPKRREVTNIEFSRFRENTTQLKLTERELEFFNVLHKNINEVNRNIGVGFRILKQIDRYLNNIPETEILTREKALDIQVVQRIMTKLRGTQDQWKEFIGEYNDETKKIQKSKILSIIEEYSEISRFDLVKKVIKNKAKELNVYGYTI